MSVQKGIIVPCNVIWVIKSRRLRTLQVSSNFNVSLYYNHTIDIREIHKLSLLMYVFNFGIRLEFVIRECKENGFCSYFLKKITDIRKIFLRPKISSSVHIYRSIRFNLKKSR